MEKAMLKKLVSILVIALFVISFAHVAVSMGKQEAQETMTIKGTIISISADTGKVGVLDESGKGYSLTAGSDIDLETFSKGDKVTIKCSSEGVIKSITKQEG
jgi:hypothetical protein